MWTKGRLCYLFNFACQAGGGYSLNSVREYVTGLVIPFPAVSFIYSHCSLQAPREALSQMVLAEVPKQLVSYYKLQGWPPVKLPETKKM